MPARLAVPPAGCLIRPHLDLISCGASSSAEDRLYHPEKNGCRYAPLPAAPLTGGQAWAVVSGVVLGRGAGGEG